MFCIYVNFKALKDFVLWFPFMGTQGFSLSDLLEKSWKEGGFLLQWCVIGEEGYGCFCLYRLALGFWQY